MKIPFDIGNIPGPEMAEIATPRAMGRAIRNAKRPLLVVGSEALEDGLLDKAIAIGKKGVTIAATAHSMKGFVEAGYTENVHMCGLHELQHNLASPDWKGFDGKGGYDLVILFGVIYYSGSQFLCSVKNNATDPLIRRISIDRYYHPNAWMTGGNISRKHDEQYIAMLDEVIENI